MAARKMSNLPLSLPVSRIRHRIPTGGICRLADFDTHFGCNQYLLVFDVGNGAEGGKPGCRVSANPFKRRLGCFTVSDDRGPAY